MMCKDLCKHCIYCEMILRRPTCNEHVCAKHNFHHFHRVTKCKDYQRMAQNDTRKRDTK